MSTLGTRTPDDPRNSRVFLTRELHAEGIDDQAIRRMVAQGELVRVRRGAFVAADVWGRLDDAARHGLRGRAILKQSKTDLVLSHTSALPEYDAPTWGIPLDEVHVTRLDGKAGRREAGVVQHCGVILTSDVVTRNGLPVMSATRLALEMTTVAPVEPSLVVVNHLLHHGATTPTLLARRWALMEYWPNTLTTDLVLRLADGRVESVGESRALHLCFRQGLPMPVPQYEIKDAAGTVVARVDFAWPERGVFLEFDGRVKYEALLQEGERASDVVLREKRREELICRLTGWRCVRITWADLSRPAYTAAAIRSAFRAAAA